MAVKTIDGDFCDAFFVKLSSGGFYVEYCVQVLCVVGYWLSVGLSVAKDTTSNPNHVATAFDSELVIARHAHRERFQLTVFS